MRKLISAAAVAVALAFGAAATPAAAITFQGDYDVSLSSTDPGLKVFYAPIVSDVNGLNFALNQGQSTGYFNLFRIYTDESAVNFPEDFASEPIEVQFNFSLPSIFGGHVDGTTQGQGLPITLPFVGVVVLGQHGTLTWANSGTQTFNFGNGGKLLVDLEDAAFNRTGPLALNFGDGVVRARFDLVQAPVPEPATWAMMLLGFASLGAVVRRNRRASAALA